MWPGPDKGEKNLKRKKFKFEKEHRHVPRYTKNVYEFLLKGILKEK